MAQMIKVYDQTGKYVDSFNLDNITVPQQTTSADGVVLEPVYVRATKEQAIAILNSRGFFVRKQFSKSGKTLMRAYRIQL